MDIGISTACFYPEILTENTIKIIAELGFKTVEIFLETASEYEKDYCKNLRNIVDEYGLNVHSVHSFAMQHEPFLFDKYPPRKRDAYDVFLKVVKGARALGAKHITFHGLPRKRFGKDTSGLLEIATEMDNLAEIAAGYDLSLAWENVYWCLSQNPDFMREVMYNTKSANISCTLDLKQANRSQIPVERYLEVMGQRLVTVHINDYSAKDTCLLPGRGHADYPGLFKTLMEIGYDGPFIIEVYRGDFKGYDELVHAKDFLVAAGRRK